MTTPRDAIGLSDRLRFDAARCELHFSKGVARNIEEAATALDALQARVKELEEQRDEARKASNLGCDARDGGAHSIMVQGSYKFSTGCGSTIRTPTLQERARAAESRVKVFEVELNGAIERSKMLLDAKIHWMDRALRAEQERDEAVALLVRVNTLAKMPAWRRMPDGASFYTTPLAGDIDAAMRRLAAGTEKEGK